MVVEIPISEKSAYEAGPTTNKNYKEKETNNDKISVNFEKEDYKKTDKRKIGREENNNRSIASPSVSTSLSGRENKEPFTKDRCKIPTIEDDWIYATAPDGNKTISESRRRIIKHNKNDDLKKTSSESLPVSAHKEHISTASTGQIDACNDLPDGRTKNSNIKPRKSFESKSTTSKTNKSLTPGKNYNAPLFIPSKKLSTETATAPTGACTTFYINSTPVNVDQNCLYYQPYHNPSSYYDSLHHPLHYYSAQSSSIHFNYIQHNDISNNQSNDKQSREVGLKSIREDTKEKNLRKSNEESSKNPSEKVTKTSHSKKLSVIERADCPGKKQSNKESVPANVSKEAISEMAAASVDCFTPSHYDQQGGGECANNSGLEQAFDETPFVASPPVLSPITGNHGDLFINPAFAAQVMQGPGGPIQPGPTTFMSFLSDGSLVGPMGEIYCPSTDFYLVDQNGDVPPALVPSPQANSFDGEYGIGVEKIS